MAKKLKSESNESESAQSSPIGKTAKKDLIKAENVQNDVSDRLLMHHKFIYVRRI